MKNEPTTTRGIVIPVACDEAGFAVSLVIVTYREERVVVDDTPAGWKP